MRHGLRRSMNARVRKVTSHTFANYNSGPSISSEFQLCTILRHTPLFSHHQEAYILPFSCIFSQSLVRSISPCVSCSHPRSQNQVVRGLSCPAISRACSFAAPLPRQAIIPVIETCDCQSVPIYRRHAGDTAPCRIIRQASGCVIGYRTAGRARPRPD